MPNRSVKELVDEIKGLRIKELTGLTEAIEEEFGVSGEPQDGISI